MIAIIAVVCAALAALLHVYIFVMESVQWTRPAVWRRFGVRDQASAAGPVRVSGGVREKMEA